MAKWMKLIHGIDVSDDQGDIDWASVARSGVEAAYIQFGYQDLAGQWHRTRFGLSNGMRALAEGIRVGAYLFCVPSLSSGTEGTDKGLADIMHDLDTIDLEADNHKIAALSTALDIELNPHNIDVVGYLEYMVRELETPAHNLAVYSNPGFWSAHVARTDLHVQRIEDIGIGRAWVAAWGAPEPPILAGLPRPFCWQISSRGRVRGIDGPVDFDVWGEWETGTQTPETPQARDPRIAKALPLLKEAVGILQG
jgi:lysozyme